jgi:hypothetical protein
MAVVTGGKQPNDPSQFRWINILLDKLETSCNGAFDALNFDKYARLYIGGYYFRCNRHFAMDAKTKCNANAVC